MEPDPSPLSSFLRILGASFRVGRFFGTEVRVYGVALILLLIVALPLKELSRMSPGARWTYVLGGALLLYLTIWLHEMGHVTAGRRYGIDTALITLSPLGGLAHMKAAAPHPRAEIVISLAGPLTHVLLLAVFWPLSRLLGEGSDPLALLAEQAVWMNVVLLGFNLLPFLPLDGGSVLRGLLALRMHPSRATLWAARVGLLGAGLMIGYGILVLRGLQGGMLMMIGLTNLLSCLQSLREARYAESPYQAAREPWEEDADAWKAGSQARDEAPTPVPRAPRTATEPDSAELDRLLDRVREVGLSGLSATERAALERAAAARRSGR